MTLDVAFGRFRVRGVSCGFVAPFSHIKMLEHTKAGEATTMIMIGPIRSKIRLFLATMARLFFVEYPKPFLLKSF